MAADLHGLLTHLDLDRDINLVGHDIDTMVAYAYAAAHPTNVTKLALTEAPIPDETIYRFPSLTPQGPGFWNLGFFNVRNGLPEQIVDGREQLWVERFIDQLAVLTRILFDFLASAPEVPGPQPDLDRDRLGSCRRGRGVPSCG